MTSPNLFLFGAPRSGTTQIARQLASHPMIDLCPIKEPNFFAAEDFDPEYVRATHLDDLPVGTRPNRPTPFAVVRDWGTYLDLFQGMTAPYRMEASTSYLSSPNAAKAVAAACPDARVILVTRDPVARAISHYRLARRTGRTRATLGAEITTEMEQSTPLCARYILRPSRQQEGVQRVHHALANDRICHVRFEDYRTDPESVLAVIADFLGCPVADFDRSTDARNQSAEPRFPALNAALFRSGAKTRLRQIMGPRSKALIKRVWFRDTPAETLVSPEEVARLRDLLDDEYRMASTCGS